jgi:hypothetical protein
MTKIDISWKICDLKKECSKYKLPTYGTKAVLVKRIKYLKGNVKEVGDEDQDNDDNAQQTKRNSRSPSPTSISDLTISDPNNTNMDIENSALQTPNNMVSGIKITKKINSNNNSKSNEHNSSKHPNKQVRNSTSTLFNKTVAQSNKETSRNNV